MTVEKTIDRRIAKKVKEIAGFYIKLPGSAISGLPDRLILLKGAKVLFAELKSKKKPGKLQLYIHKKLRCLGFRIFVIADLETCNNFISTEL